MPCRSLSHHRLPRLATPVLALAASLALAAASAAAPTLGFVETFPGTSLSTWDGGAIDTNPGTGGTGGNGDGYLNIKTPNGTQHKLGADSPSPEYAGDWQAAGVTQVRLWLNDVGIDDPLQMHFAIGNTANFWQYNVAFLPPLHQWAEFVVDLTNGANFTRIIGTGTFAQALQTADRILVRHDLAPFAQVPDNLDGDVGLDHVLLTNGNVGVEPLAQVPRALALAAPSPNPSRGDVMVSLETFEADAVKLEVVDVAGRIVRHAELTSAGPATLRWQWNGLGDDGRPTPAGYYSVRAIGRSGGASRGLVRIN